MACMTSATRLFRGCRPATGRSAVERSLVTTRQPAPVAESRRCQLKEFRCPARDGSAVLDRGSTGAASSHAVCVLDHTGRRVAAFRIEHSAAGFTNLVRRLSRLATVDRIAVAIERATGWSTPCSRPASRWCRSAPTPSGPGASPRPGRARSRMPVMRTSSPTTCTAGPPASTRSSPPRKARSWDAGVVQLATDSVQRQAHACP